MRGVGVECTDIIDAEEVAEYTNPVVVNVENVRNQLNCN